MLALEIHNTLFLIDHTCISQLSIYNITKSKSIDIPTLILSFPVCSLQIFLLKPPFESIFNIYNYLLNDFKGIPFTVPGLYNDNYRITTSQTSSATPSNETISTKFTNFLSFPTLLLDSIKKNNNSQEISNILNDLESSFISTKEIDAFSHFYNDSINKIVFLS